MPIEQEPTVIGIWHAMKSSQDAHVWIMEDLHPHAAQYDAEENLPWSQSALPQWKQHDVCFFCFVFFSPFLAASCTFRPSSSYMPDHAEPQPIVLLAWAFLVMFGDMVAANADLCLHVPLKGNQLGLEQAGESLWCSSSDTP